MHILRTATPTWLRLNDDAGIGSHAQYKTLESLTHALGFILYVFCAWVLIWFAINILSEPLSLIVPSAFLSAPS